MKRVLVLAWAAALLLALSSTALAQPSSASQPMQRLRCAGVSTVRVVEGALFTRVRNDANGQLLLKIGRGTVENPGKCTSQPVGDDQPGRHGLGNSDETGLIQVKCTFAKNKSTVLWYQIDPTGDSNFPPSSKVYVGFDRAGGDDFYASDRQQKANKNLSYDGNKCKPF